MTSGRLVSDARRPTATRKACGTCRICLALLPSGPDAVRRLRLHRFRAAVRRASRHASPLGSASDRCTAFGARGLGAPRRLKTRKSNFEVRTSNFLRTSNFDLRTFFQGLHFFQGLDVHQHVRDPRQLVADPAADDARDLVRAGDGHVRRHLDVEVDVVSEPGLAGVHLVDPGHLGDGRGREPDALESSAMPASCP